MSIKGSIIIRPILSEKGNMLSETQGKYVFQVEKVANKMEIKKAIEEKFKVEIKKINGNISSNIEGIFNNVNPIGK